jgi:hypothetical protein
MFLDLTTCYFARARYHSVGLRTIFALDFEAGFWIWIWMIDARLDYNISVLLELNGSLLDSLIWYPFACSPIEALKSL